MEGTNVTIAVLFLVISLFGVGYLVVQEAQAGKRQVRDRIKRVGRASEQAAKPAPRDKKVKKQSVESTLEDMAEQKKAQLKKNKKVSLHLRMRQGGVMWSRPTYFLVSTVIGLAAGFLLWAGNGTSPFIASSLGLAAGLLFPHVYVGFKRKRRLKRFSKEFPNAIDVIARGLRTGLPLGDCMKIIARESTSPVKDEFQMLVDDQMLGETLHVAAENLSHRVPLTEVNFFAIVIAIQSKTGGSLSESFDNLSKVLRERKMMAEKIKSVSQEAKSSAAIIGALPFLVAGIIYVMDPDYISILFTTDTGHLVLAISGTWMGMGMMVMRKMINFNF